MNILLWKACFKKEYWEYKNYLFWLPLIISILIIVIPTFSFIVKDTSGIPWLDTFRHFSSMTDSPELAKAFYRFTMGIFVPFTAIAIFIQVYYFLACLYDEKKDLSIYFWRSLPVSDSTTVIIKLLTGMFFIPATLLLAATLTLGIFLLVAFVFTIILSIGFDISFWGAWINAEIMQTIFFAWVNIIPSSLWLLPLFTWLMLASAMANKAPYLWAILPVVCLFVIETLLVSYGLLSHSYLMELFKNYFEFSPQLISQQMGDMTQLNLISINVLFSKVSVAGIMVAGGFLYATYWLRKNKSHA